jgi:cytosine/uracil/thiamine/allantoin permease
VAGLYEPRGRYRFLRGVNVAAVTATAAAVGAYYALPHASVKVVWGVAIGALAYVVLETVQRVVVARVRPSAEARVRWAE